MADKSSSLCKSENQAPFLLFLPNNSIAQIRKEEIISLTGLNLSFSDLGCFNLEFDILQPEIGCELTELYSLETCNFSALIDINMQGTDRLVQCGNKVIHMQSTNMVIVRTVITRMQTYYKAYDPKSFLFQ